jgi:hypothetical protein
VLRAIPHTSVTAGGTDGAEPGRTVPRTITRDATAACADCMACDWVGLWVCGGRDESELEARRTLGGRLRALFCGGSAGLVPALDAAEDAVPDGEEPAPGGEVGLGAPLPAPAGGGDVERAAALTAPAVAFKVAALEFELESAPSVELTRTSGARRTGAGGLPLGPSGGEAVPATGEPASARAAFKAAAECAGLLHTALTALALPPPLETMSGANCARCVLLPAPVPALLLLFKLPKPLSGAMGPPAPYGCSGDVREPVGEVWRLSGARACAEAEDVSTRNTLELPAGGGEAGDWSCECEAVGAGVLGLKVDGEVKRCGARD